ncbi:type VI secretion system membrane subunit TssM [Methylobacterium sp. Leaf112]|uniref:type VI secretion system membrane subunit TssM n=1 Tax=Methylobacterium sp. Leaf112 TaxID=1736258 RepID=UPI0006F2AEF7|nr:type VI secretion system membrane subunit TssM [Methylobacterium sp. Leaf112]KQP61917.1 hypothetical protein ASF52_04335 [Methylobacterium sp. Leaf112]
MNILNWIYEIRSYATTYASRVKAWWLVALIWALVAACVVFFYGDGVSFGRWRPFERFETRLYAVGAIAVGFVLYCLVRLVRGQRRDAALIDAVAAGAEADPARAAADDVAELKSRLRDALKLLRKTMGRASVYALPWYALIGPPGSGKTTALRNSGLRFPLADSVGESVEGVGGTRHCDWWFTDEAILIDTAGRYTAQEGDGEADAAGWRGFLTLLRKHRRRQPLNGAIVMVGMDLLVQASATERLHHARTIRKRLRELDEAFGLRVPVYLVLTKADRLAGFTAFFDDMARTGREQVWGVTLPPPRGGIEGRDLADRFGSAFDRLVGRLDQLLLDRLQAETDPERRAQIFAFPSQLALIAEPLHETIGEIAASSRFDAPPRLRGLYLASAEQSGSGLDLVTRSASQRFAIDLPRFGAASADGQHSYFLARLLREVIFNEANLVSTNPALERRRRILRSAAGGLAAALVLGLSLTWLVAYLRQERMLSDTDARLAVYTAGAGTLPVEAVADTDFVRAEVVLSQARDAATPFTEAGTPRLLDTFDQAEKISAGRANLYERALTGFLLPRILVALGNTLREAGAAGDADAAPKPNPDAPVVPRGMPRPPAAVAREAVPGVAGAASPRLVRESIQAGVADLGAKDAGTKDAVSKDRGAKDADAGSAGADIGETLRLYRMLGGADSLDKPFADARLEGLFARLYPEEKHAVLRTSLDGHVAAMLARPLVPIALDETLIAGAEGKAQVVDLARRWSQAGEQACRAATDRRFPFDRNAAADTPLGEFAAVFGPEGVFATFFRTHMADAVDGTGKPWRWRSAGSAALLRSFEDADEVRQAFFPAAGAQPALAFEVTPIRLDPEATAASFVSDGQEAAFSRGSARPLRFTWPTPGLAGPAARVSVQPGAPEALSFTGPWALLRLLDAGRAEAVAPDRTRVNYGTASHAVTFEIRSLALPNPFGLAALRSFRCPRFP